MKERLLTSQEVATLVKNLRQVRSWSQEKLAERSKLSVRTIQRVELGSWKESDRHRGRDTRRSIARAFEFDDIDAFDKPVPMPTSDEVLLEAASLTTGKDLMNLAETCDIDQIDPRFDSLGEVDEVFAEMIDLFRDYRDARSDCSEAAKLGVRHQLQAHVDELREKGASICYAVQKVKIRWKQGKGEPMTHSILYLAGFPAGQEPKHFAIPKDGVISL